MRSDLFALTAAVAGCAAAAPAAQPQWGSWGNGGGWGNNGGWGQAPPSQPEGGSAGGIAAPTEVSAPVASPAFPTATAPVGTGIAPIGTGVAPIGTGVAATGTAPVRAVSTGSTSQAPATNSSSSTAGQTGESTDASGLNALFVAKGKEYFGTCADPGTLSSTETVDIINADFGQITPENRYVLPKLFHSAAPARLIHEIA